MSFPCQICKTPQKEGTRPIKVVLDKRERVYKNSFYNDDEKLVTKSSSGWEIVKEADACQECADKALLATPVA